MRLKIWSTGPNPIRWTKWEISCCRSKLTKPGPTSLWGFNIYAVWPGSMFLRFGKMRKMGEYAFALQTCAIKISSQFDGRLCDQICNHGNSMISFLLKPSLSIICWWFFLVLVNCMHVYTTMHKIQCIEYKLWFNYYNLHQIETIRFMRITAFKTTTIHKEIHAHLGLTEFG